MPDVKRWFEDHIKTKKQVYGQNSFVANGAFHEYQLDLFFINHLTNQEYTVALVCIDAFIKFAVVEAIEGKTQEDLGYAMISAFVKMGKNPKVVYTDAETGRRNSTIFKTYFDENQITVHYTKSRAAVEERLIRTFKDMLDKRIRANEQWNQHIYAIMLTYSCKLIQSYTGYTPYEARTPVNELDMYLNLKIKAKYGRTYPELLVEDEVYIYTKRKLFDKSHVSVWSDNTYRIDGISRSHGLTFYHTTHRDRPHLRNELL